MNTIFNRPFQSKRRNIIINIHANKSLYLLMVKFANKLRWNMGDLPQTKAEINNSNWTVGDYYDFSFTYKTISKVDPYIIDASKVIDIQNKTDFIGFLKRTKTKTEEGPFFNKDVPNYLVGEINPENKNVLAELIKFIKHLKNEYQWKLYSSLNAACSTGGKQWLSGEITIPKFFVFDFFEKEAFYLYESSHNLLKKTSSVTYYINTERDVYQFIEKFSNILTVADYAFYNSSKK